MRFGVVVVVVAGLLLTACTATTEPAPTGSASMSPASATPTPAPSASAAPLAPVSPVAGGCDALAAAQGVADIVGHVQRVTELDELWNIGIATAGGLACSMMTTRVLLDVYIIPDAQLTGDLAALTSAAECEVGARAMQCRAPISSNGHVTLAVGSFSKSADTAEALALMGSLAGAFDASTTEGAPTRSQAATWHAPLDCDAIAQIVGLSSILGVDENRTSRVRASASTVEGRLAAAPGLAARCDWSRAPTQRDDHGSSYSVTAVPNGAWAWHHVASNVPDSMDATLGGFAARVTSTGEVYICDGVNILHLEGAHLAGISVVDTALGVLSVLESGASQTRG